MTPIIDWIARLVRRGRHTAEDGFEYYGAEPTDPSQDQHWRSRPHPTRTVVPSQIDWLAEVLKTLQDHRNGIDEATGPFLDALIDAQTRIHRIAARQHYPVQVRTDQGLYASEAGYLQQLRLQEQALLRRLSEADEDYRAGRDALLGIPGATPARDARTTSGGFHIPETELLPAPSPQLASLSDQLPVPEALPGPELDEQAAAELGDEDERAA